MDHRIDLTKASPVEIRKEIREGRFCEETAGLAGGYLQGNIAIMPASLATDFFRFCQRNPKPCPLVGVSETGDPMLPALGMDIDIRTDIPRYKIFRDGEFVEQVTDINEYWSDDLVTFVLGCSFSFEEALMAEGISVRHIEQKRNVPMYHSNIAAKAAGPFKGELVVSMRPLPVADAIRAVEITSRFTRAHGAPIHLGDPAEIGINNINQPDFGDPVDIRDGEIPVFWACGVTPQIAIRNAKPPLSITHAPGHMLITDIRGSDA